MECYVFKTLKRTYKQHKGRETEKMGRGHHANEHDSQQSQSVEDHETFPTIPPHYGSPTAEAQCLLNQTTCTTEIHY